MLGDRQHWIVSKPSAKQLALATKALKRGLSEEDAERCRTYPVLEAARLTHAREFVQTVWFMLTDASQLDDVAGSGDRRVSRCHLVVRLHSPWIVV